MSVIGTTSFTGSNADPWPSPWTTGSNGTGTSAQIQSNRGRLTTGTGTGYGSTKRVSRMYGTTTDVTQRFKVRHPGNEVYAQVWLRADTGGVGSSGYATFIDFQGSKWRVYKSSSFVDTTLTNTVTGTTADVTQTFTSNTDYWVEFGVEGTGIKARIWQDGNSVPAWQWESTDSTHSSGYYGIAAYPGNAANTYYEVDDWDGRTTLAEFANITGTAALSVTTTLSASGVAVNLGSAALSTATALTATGRDTALATSALSVATALSAAGVPSKVGSAALSVATSLAADGSNAPTGTAALSVATAISAVGIVEELAAAALSVATDLSATGAPVVMGAASLSVTASLSAGGTVTEIASAALSVMTSVGADAFVSEFATAALSAATGLTAAGFAGLTGDSALTVHTTLSTVGFNNERAQAVISAHTILVAVGHSYVPPEPQRGRVQIYARNASLQVLGEIDDFVTCNATKVYNDVGTWELVLNAASPNADLIDPSINIGGGIIIRLDGKTFMTGPIQQMSDDWSDANGTNDTLTITGTDDNIWLSYRDIYPNPAQTPETMSSSYYRTASLAAESIMIDLVNKNMGPGALVARRLPNISIPATLSRGKVQKSPKYRFDTILEALQELSTLSQVGSDQTTQLQFNLQQEGQQLVFKVSNGAGKSSLVRFSKKLGTLQAYNRTTTAATATNLVLGAGLEEVPDDSSGTRVAKALFSYERTDPSYPGRKEQFVDVGAIDPTTGDADDIQEQLDQQANDTFNTTTGQVGATLVPRDTTFQAFAVDYDLGDFCTVILPRLTFVERVREAALTRSVDNGTQIVISVGSANGAYQRRSSGTYRRISDLKHYTDRLKKEK